MGVVEAVAEGGGGPLPEHLCHGMAERNGEENKDGE